MHLVPFHPDPVVLHLDAPKAVQHPARQCHSHLLSRREFTFYSNYVGTQWGSKRCPQLGWFKGHFGSSPSTTVPLAGSCPISRKQDKRYVPSYLCGGKLQAPFRGE